MNNTLIAGPHKAQHIGGLHEFARTLSYSYRIRALARTAVHEERAVVPGPISARDGDVGPENPDWPLSRSTFHRS